ncbi:Gfo/Idh/MocA family protein [Agilicoccus flavus]|uniref:Gfo/Idh/MocA family protein n=1 Tax=Agilicoccus flavus TaxID=2775968 RepID=UPI001CF679D2|nr:Gfo/Idh/MocA family oxidoreductase [Agilicoccus flavus]
MSTPTLTIVGAGVIGRHHGNVVDELGGAIELAAVVDPVEERAEQVAGPRGARTFPDLRSALEQAQTDLVAVCTPTGTHGELTIQALRAGRDVVVEKPAEITPAKIDEVIAARDESGGFVSVISQHRFDPSTRLLLDRIAAGELGTLVSGIASIDWYRSQGYYDSGNWRGTWELDGGGALMNQGVHTVDLLVAAFGRPVEVTAYTATLAHERIEVEDTAVGVVRFESGALGVLHATTAVYPGLSARLHVHGSRGSAVIDDDALTFLHVTPAGVDLDGPDYGGSRAGNQAADHPEASSPPPRAAGADPSALSQAHVWQYENILAARRGEEPLVVGLEENRRSVALICGVYESARTGAPVRL